MGRVKNWAARKRRTHKEVADGDADDAEIQVIRESKCIGDSAQGLCSAPSSSRYLTQSNHLQVTGFNVAECTVASYRPGDQTEKVSSHILEKFLQSSRAISPNLTGLIQTINENLSVADEVDSTASPVLVTVAGYKVKQDIAQLLREIFRKHGDIASECILQTSESRAPLLEMACIVYQEVEHKILHNIPIELNIMLARVKDLETVRLNVGWLRQRIEQSSIAKSLLDKLCALKEAKTVCMESIQKKERCMEALQEELFALQQKLSSEKAELASLMAEAKRIDKAIFSINNEVQALHPQSLVSVTGGQKKCAGSTPSTEILVKHNSQGHAQAALEHNNYFNSETNEQLSENDLSQPDPTSIPNSKSQSRDPCIHPQPHSDSPNQQYYTPGSCSQPHSNFHSQPHHLTQLDSENESDYGNKSISSEEGNDTNPPGDDSSLDESSNHEGKNLVRSSRKRGRGRAKAFDDWGTGRKMMLQLNEHNQVIGNLASTFASQLGTIAKDGNKLPLTYKDWRAVPKDYKERVWQELEDNTNLPDDCKKTMLQRVSKLWRNWKSTVKESYFIPYRKNEEKLARCPPDVRIKEDQWPILVRFWKSKAARKRSMLAKKSRKELKLLSTTGRTDLANLREKLRKELGGEPSKLDLFLESKQPVDDSAAEKVAILKEKRDKLPEQMRTDKASKDQIYDEELGPGEPGQVRTYGLGVTPAKLIGATMRMSETQKKAFDLAVKAQVEAAVGNMRETMAAHMEEKFSYMKEAWMSDLVVSGIPFSRIQVPESASSQPTAPSHFENIQREVENHNSQSFETECSKKRKKTHEENEADPSEGQFEGLDNAAFQYELEGAIRG